MAQSQIEGEYVVAVVDSVAEVSPVFESRAREILADAGVEEPEASAAYDADDVADALQTMAETAGETTVRRAGEEMVRRNDAILAAASFADGFDVMAEQHEAVHRNFSTEAVGHYRRDRLGDREHRVATYGGYRFPEPLARGAVEGVLEETESPAMVAFEDATPEADEVHAFVVSW